MALLTDDPGESAWRRAAVISLLTWRRADAGDVLDDDQRYGWWGDSFPTLGDDRIGSRLWLLRRRSLTADTERDAVAFAREALAWMLDDGRVSAVTVTAARGVNRLDLVVVLSLRDGTAIDVQLDNFWQVINAV
nr:phage GP46 family protein [Pseudomonas sp. Irchel 3E13]